MRYYVTLDHDELAVDVVRQPSGRLQVSVGGEKREVDVVEAGGALNVRVGDGVYDLYLEGPNDGKLGFVGGGTRRYARVESERQRIGASAKREAQKGGRVCAPMPGRVVKLLVQVGDEVSPGQPVIVVEAMKMENEIHSEHAGVVTAVHAREGENVDGGAVLIELGAEPA